MLCTHACVVSGTLASHSLLCAHTLLSCTYTRQTLGASYSHLQTYDSWRALQHCALSMWRQHSFQVSQTRTLVHTCGRPHMHTHFHVLEPTHGHASPTCSTCIRLVGYLCSCLHASSEFPTPYMQLTTTCVQGQIRCVCTALMQGQIRGRL